jgi:hypothetical protein
VGQGTDKLSELCSRGYPEKDSCCRVIPDPHLFLSDSSDLLSGSLLNAASIPVFRFVLRLIIHCMIHPDEGGRNGPGNFSPIK